MIEFASAWAALDAAGRDAAWSTPHGWATFIESLPTENTIQAARAELRYLRFPEYFLPIVSKEHRERIRDAFIDEIGTSSGHLDDDLFSITLALQAEAGGAIDYYVEPYKQRWDAGAAPSQSVKRAWLIRGSSVKGVNITDDWRSEGFVSLAASQLPILEPPYQPASIRDAVDEGYSTLSYVKRGEKLRDIRAFLLTVSPGDIVVTTSDGALYAGVVTGEAQFVDSVGGRSNLRRAAEWVSDQEPVDYAELSAPVKARLRSSGDLTDLTDLIGDLEPLVETLTPDDSSETAMIEADQSPRILVTGDELKFLPHADPASLLVSEAWVRDVVGLLNEKRQVVLYGPPGTGKTYQAQKIAELVAPFEAIRIVQFHPSYSYEDFFEGYRPVATGDDGRMSFVLRPGPFRRIVSEAEAHPDVSYVLIIDEINRANLAKVFGELYFLLEYRDQAIDLLYADENVQSFTLPKNVFIIGTMNTADRSIAMVDSAMRRRFGFISVHPDDPEVKQLLPRWLERESRDQLPARLLDALNARIDDRDMKIGPSYFMTPASASSKGLERIWRTSIMPLLEELHFGDGVNVEERYKLSALLRSLGEGDDGDVVGESDSEDE